MSDLKKMKAATILCVTLLATTALAETTKPQPDPPAPWESVLSGAAYYNEYMPADLQPGRLDKDIALMKQADLSVVRMGESTWSLWEPEDGRFEYALMDRVVDAMGKPGIKVLLGAPTYSLPTWMYHEHPEVLAEPLNGAHPSYGMR